MFKSIEYDFVGKGKGYIYSFKIIDDDFEKSINLTVRESAVYPYLEGAIEAITQCYSNKNMNVAANIFLYLRYHTNIYGLPNYTIKELINKYVPTELKNEVEKYLLLL